MALLKIKCPECSAGLKSAAGFTPGQTVCCPKCETYFAVEEPDGDEPRAGKKPVKAAVSDDDEDDDEDHKPRKKKKKARAYDEDEDGERSYKKSPLRFVILGVLVVVMLVLAYFLYDKKKKEREAADGTPAPADVDATGQPRLANPNGGPKLQPAGVGNNGNLPGRNPNPRPKPKGPDVGAVAVGAVGDLLGGGGPRNPAEAAKMRAKYTAALVGTWTADLGDGAAEELTYAADGTFIATRTGPDAATAEGKYAVKGLVGTKGLKLQLTTDAGTRTATATAVFEDDELQHPSLQPGITATFRKK